MGMAVPRFYTADMVRALNEAEPRHWPRYETVHGELLVSPAPRPWHQVVASRLHIALGIYLQREPVGEAFMSPSEISWGLPDIYVQPDVFVVPVEQLRTLEWKNFRLLLAAEALSPSTSRADRTTKRRLYQEQGVHLYWIIDADAETVAEWTPEAREGRIEREALIWHPRGASTPFTLALEALFRPV